MMKLFLFFVCAAIVSTASTVEASAWRTQAAMNVPRTGFGMVDVAGKLYACGGKQDNAAYADSAPRLRGGAANVTAAARRLAFTPTCEVFAGNSWSTDVPSMVQYRFNHGMTVVDGIIYAAGGTCDGNDAHCGKWPNWALNTIESLDPSSSSNEWTLHKDRMSTMRNYLGVGNANGKVVALGGYAIDAPNPGWDVPLASIDVFDPATQQWAAGPAMNKARAGPLVASLDNKVYVMGGCTSGNCDAVDASVEVLDGATMQWTVMSAHLSSARWLGAGAALGTRVYAVDGENQQAGTFVETHAEFYDTAAPGKGWQTITNTTVARQQSAAAALGEDGELWTCGGSKGWNQWPAYTSCESIKAAA